MAFEKDTIKMQKPKKQKSPRATLSEIEAAQMSLFELEQKGKFSQYPLNPTSEFPTLLTRLPIFIPGNRSNQKALFDSENAIPFKTSWGEGRRVGPPLTVYDEDTLIAIGRLRQKRLIGRPHNLPTPVPEIYRKGKEPDVNVHVMHLTLSQIQEACGTESGGNNNELRLTSIRRLGTTTLEFTTKTSDKFVSKGTIIKLIDVAWQEYDKNAILYIQFTPIMAEWFDQAYTYIDWNVRQELTETGKAIHRFLSGQPKTYEIHTKKLMTIIGYQRPYAKFMADLRASLTKLEEKQWISSWDITGNGRKIPHKLLLKRG